MQDLFQNVGYCEQCCNDHRSADISSRTRFYFHGMHSYSITAGSHCTSFCKFLKKFNTVLHDGCTILHSLRQCRKAAVSPPPHQYAISFFFFWIIHIVTEERHYFMVFLMGISLILVMLGPFHSSMDRVCL